MQLEYERYKELVTVEFTGDSEERVLKSIVEKEHKVNLARLQKLENRKKKLVFVNLKRTSDFPRFAKSKYLIFRKVTNKKATVGFSYDDGDAEVEEEGGDASTSKKNFQKPESESDSSDDGGDDELFCRFLYILLLMSIHFYILNFVVFQLPNCHPLFFHPMIGNDSTNLPKSLIFHEMLFRDSMMLIEVANWITQR